MAAYIIRRALGTALILLALSGVVFLAVYEIGSPAQILIDPKMPPTERERAIMTLGWDQPSWVQYARFVARMVHGDLGQSFVYDRPAMALVLERLPATLELAAAAVLLALAFGLPIGVWAGLKPRTLLHRVAMAIALLGVSIPTFWAGVMLVLVFSGILHWLPPIGRGPTTLIAGVPVNFLSLDGWRHLAMPALSLSLGTLALFIRLARDGTRHALAQNYVKFARARGISTARIVGMHVLRNMLGLVTMLTGYELASLTVFAMVTEVVFAWPGVGRLLVDSIKVVDGPVVVAYVMIVVSLFIVINLVVDVLTYTFDPRRRMAGGEAELAANGSFHPVTVHDGR